MRRIFLDLIAFARHHNNEFTSRDLKKIMHAYGHSITDANVMHYLYAFLVLADRRFTSTNRKKVGKYTYKLYNISSQTLQDMNRRLQTMRFGGCWIQTGLQRTNPSLGITVQPRMENGMEMLLF